MVISPIGVALYGVLRFTVFFFFLVYIIIPISAKGLQRHTMMCCTLSSASAFGARQSAALHKHVAALHRFPPTLPIILAQVVEKPFLRILR
jgi:hypothetical protein